MAGEDVAKELNGEIDTLRAEIERLKAQDEVRSGRWCNGNMAEGRGPCGICPKCSKANFDRAEIAELQIDELKKAYDLLFGAANRVYHKYGFDKDWTEWKDLMECLSSPHPTNEVKRNHDVCRECGKTGALVALRETGKPDAAVCMPCLLKHGKIN